MLFRELFIKNFSSRLSAEEKRKGYMSESKTSSAFWKLSNERPFLSLQAKNLAVALIFLVSDYVAVMLASGTAFILREYVLTLVMPYSLLFRSLAHIHT